MEKYLVNGLMLPSALIRLIELNQWNAPKDKSKLKSLLTLPKHLQDDFTIGSSKEHDYFSVYSVETMKRATESLKKWLKRFAHSSNENVHHIEFNGDTLKVLDEESLVAIAGFDIGSDISVVLNYTENPKNPSVVILCWEKNPPMANKWLKVANDFESFSKAIGLKLAPKS